MLFLYLAEKLRTVLPERRPLAAPETTELAILEMGQPTNCDVWAGGFGQLLRLRNPKNTSTPLDPLRDGSKGQLDVLDKPLAHNRYNCG